MLFYKGVIFLQEEIIMKKRVTFILVVLWMIVIFCFSAQNGTKSSGISRFIGYGIVEKQNELQQQEKSKEKMEEQVEGMQFLIRKSGHMGEYALLSILVLIHMSCYTNKPKSYRLWGWGICILYAITDEIHQLFVPGRSGRIFDVGVDTIGSLIGIVVFTIFLQLFVYFCKKN